ncbi:MAG: sulfotransferase family protein [Acidimicrobiales bacterium]
MGAARAPWRVLTSAAKVASSASLLPSFLVIGGKRCGSTSLYRYLVRHPSILACRVEKGTHYFDVHFERGWRWYRAGFPTKLRGAYLKRAHGVDVITGEASPYYMFHPLAPARIADALPDVRLIAVLRDPVDRAWSHYLYSVHHGFEDLPFDDALDREEARLAGEEERIAAEPSYISYSHRHHSYLARGRYAEQLERVYDHFPTERVFIVKSEALFADPDATCARVVRFLGREPVPLGAVNAHNAGTSQPMPTAIRDRLTSYYEEPNRRLARLPGVDFTWGPQ